jgi:hypothetical protein
MDNIFIVYTKVLSLGSGDMGTVLMSYLKLKLRRREG